MRGDHPNVGKRPNYIRFISYEGFLFRQNATYCNYERRSCSIHMGSAFMQPYHVDIFLIDRIIFTFLFIIQSWSGYSSMQCLPIQEVVIYIYSIYKKKLFIATVDSGRGYLFILHISLSREELRKNNEQAGAELCQAQSNLSLATR